MSEPTATVPPRPPAGHLGPGATHDAWTYVLGSFVGGMIQDIGVEATRDIVRNCAESDDFWQIAGGYVKRVAKEIYPQVREDMAAMGADFPDWEQGSPEDKAFEAAVKLGADVVEGASVHGCSCARSQSGDRCCLDV